MIKHACELRSYHRFTQFVVERIIVSCHANQPMPWTGTYVRSQRWPVGAQATPKNFSGSVSRHGCESQENVREFGRCSMDTLHGSRSMQASLAVDRARRSKQDRARSVHAMRAWPHAAQQQACKKKAKLEGASQPAPSRSRGFLPKRSVPTRQSL